MTGRVAAADAGAHGGLAQTEVVCGLRQRQTLRQKAYKRRFRGREAEEIAQCLFVGDRGGIWIRDDDDGGGLIVIREDRRLPGQRRDDR